jgi:aminoglycoside phosphotransferase
LETEIYEADPFSAQRGTHLATLRSDYRFEKGDELFIETARGRMKVRVLQVVLRLKGERLSRDLLVLRL